MDARVNGTAIAAVTAVLALTGCGSSGSSPGRTSARVPAPSASVATPSAVPATGTATATSTGSATPTGHVPAADGPFAARPLIMPAQRADGGRPDMLGLISRVPTTADEYDRLDGAHRQLLQAALQGLDCGNLPNPGAAPVRVVCDAAGTTAMLVGAPVLRAGDVRSARAVPPSTNGSGALEWTVSITLTGAGADAWAAWTTQHHADGSAASVASTATCAPSSVPCADFVALTLGGEAVSVPVTLAAVTGGAVQVSGNFTKDSATALARAVKG